MKQNVDRGVGAELSEVVQAPSECLHVLRHLLGANIEHVDEHLDHIEDVVTLSSQVILNEAVLTSAIPQIKGDITKEAQLRVLDVDCGTEAVGVECSVVTKDDAPHRALSRATAADKQQLLSVGRHIWSIQPEKGD